jgi:tetratricopeptide (TPR) repeat protein
MSNDKLLLVKELLQNEKAMEARELFRELKPENTASYFFVKGLTEQKFQEWGAAINSFQKVLAFDPNHKEAKNHMDMIQTVLNFWNPETFNP